MEHAILHDTINGQRVNFYPETGFDDVMKVDGDDEVTLRMVLEGYDSAIALMQDNVATKANAADVYSKSAADALLNNKADKSAVYTKSEADGLLGTKADKSTTYTKTETDGLLNAKANQSTTYTKTEVDLLSAQKVDKGSSIEAKGVNNDTVALYVKDNGARGLYDTKLDGWLCFANEDDRALKLPASPDSSDNSTKVATTYFVNEYALAKIGGTMSGTIRIKSKSDDMSVSPSNYLDTDAIQFVDKNAQSMGYVYHRHETSGRHITYLSTYSEGGSNVGSGTLGVAVERNGTNYAFVKTSPPENDNSMKLATTKWVNDTTKATTQGILTIDPTVATVQGSATPKWIRNGSVVTLYADVNINVVNSNKKLFDLPFRSASYIIGHIHNFATDVQGTETTYSAGGLGGFNVRVPAVARYIIFATYITSE